MMRYFKLRIHCILSLSLIGLGSIAQTGIGTATPDTSAILDVYSNSKGLLAPRVALTAANLAAPVTNPATSLLVYNTATAGTAPNNVVPGFYYWANSRWNPVVNKGNNIGDMQYWNGAQWVAIPAGTQGQSLTWCNGKPQWGPCIASPLTIKPVNNQYEGIISNFFPSSWQTSNTQMLILSWTSGGQPVDIRELIRFDYSTLPLGAIIDSAKLYMYGDPAPLNGNLVDAHFGPTNSFYIQRITSNWTLPTPFTWNNPPAASTTNQVVIPQSTSSFQDCVADVTQLVKDQISFGNNGFLMRLLNEIPYNSRQYLSSKSSDPNKHPRIVIYYH
jgi:hypothetical protein